MISPARRRGFTILELMIVVAIMMVVSAIALPNIMNALNAYRLRTSASGVAGLFQKTRMLAVSEDRWDRVATDTAGGQTFVFADLNSPPNGILDLDTEKQLVSYLPRGITIDSTPPADITPPLVDFTPAKGLPAFNARGLPCTAGTGVCKPTPGTGSGYVSYLRQDRSLGTPGWAAVTVSPAGRTRVWSWDGAAWK